MYGTEPLAHQKRLFEKTRDLVYWGNLSEQGTGKTKVFIDTACWLYNKNEIDAVLVTAPNGVHVNWVNEELPTHFPEHTDYYAAAYFSQPRAAQRKAMQQVWDVQNKLVFLCVNIEALSGKKAKEYVKKFLMTRRCLFIIDESHKIKTPGVARTKACLALNKLAPYRRIATGTPATENPLAFYTQLRFLHDRAHGFNNFYSFRAQYAQLEEGYNYKTSKKYKQVVGYQNMDDLMEKVNKCCDRVLKQDCIDLPDKVYESRPVLMSDEQRRVYTNLVDKIKFEFAGKEIKPAMAMTRLMQAQQVLGGFLIPPDSANRAPLPVGTSNPKMDSLVDLLEESTEKAIIYARFRAELRAIAEKLQKLYGEGSVVEYHGSVPDKDRNAVTKRFQSDSNVRFVVAQPQAAIGVTWTAATMVVYYSNDFSLLTRLQSEDRAHRIGQRNKVTYYDLFVPGTVDQKVLNALRSKREFAEVLLEDPITNWISV